MDARFETLTVKSEAKIASLLSSLDLEKRREENRLEYAARTSDFMRWCKSTIETAGSTSFGFTLADVVATEDELKRQDRVVNKTCEEKQANALSVLDAGTDMGVNENAYTEETTDSLKAAFVPVTEALGKRREAYAAELARQHVDDELCQQFAALVQGFADALIAKRAEVAGSKDELEDQLSNVESLAEKQRK
eukprot:TRINITY_DN80_c0_g1_i1.p1 TRINITY_DN80_c0_g1~~TRINITY_DN80_c0_g1_i1.p1  ORF type:complete len:193 (-),score=41.06 TRINITY_DN80_c0_g1_i1:739-1317(-)